MGKSGSRVITLKPADRVAAITMFLQDENFTCYCMTIGQFINKGEICWLPRSSEAMEKLTYVDEDHLDRINHYLKLGECVHCINELSDFITRKDNYDIKGKMDVALIKVYDDVVQHLDLIHRDETDKETTVVIGIPENNVLVKHYKYRNFSDGRVKYVDHTNGIFHIKPSKNSHELPKRFFGALVSELDNQDGETKVYGMLITYDLDTSSRHLSYYYIALQMDTVIEGVQSEMGGQVKGLHCCSLI